MTNREFSYTFFLNDTFDPSREYEPTLNGYRPGAVMTEGYSGEISGHNHFHACSKLFEMFNIDHPADYKSRSMSVGDVIMLTDGTTVRYFAVARVGFDEVGDPSLHRNPDYATMKNYFEHRGVYEEYRRNGTTNLFIPYLLAVAMLKEKGIN